MKICKISGCKIKSNCRGMCKKHYTRNYRYGTTDRLTGNPNKIIDCGDYSKILLFGGRECLIDTEDVDLVKGFVWSFSISNGVITQKQSNNKNSHKKIHRMVMGYPNEKVIDHKNGDRLDNRKCNLRVLEHWQNIINQKSKPMRNIEGSGNGFCVRISRNKKRFYLGYFPTLEEAIENRDKYAKEIHKDLRLR